VQPQPSTLSSLRIKMHLGPQHGGSHPLQRILSHQPEQRTENVEPRPQPPSDASLVQPEPYFGAGNRKVYTSWCHSPGETHLKYAGEAMNPYCVILWPEALVNPVSCPRTKRFFLRARSADGAIHAALADNPHWRVIGIEPRDLFAGLLRGASSCPKPHDWHAA
jgi:hypothetical protein